MCELTQKGLEKSVCDAYCMKNGRHASLTGCGKPQVWEYLGFCLVGRRVVNPSRKEGKCHMVNLENASAKMRKNLYVVSKILKNYPIV